MLQVVASQDITEKYLFDFRLVWRCILEQLAVVMGNVTDLCTTNPCALVDGVRVAKLLDGVIEVCASLHVNVTDPKFNMPRFVVDGRC